MESMTDTVPVESTALVCDPSNEWCDEFENTIELDYSSPNWNIGLLNYAMWLIPVFTYSFIMGSKDGTDPAVQAALNANGYYTLGWRWLKDGSQVVFGVPSIIWTIN